MILLIIPKLLLPKNWGFVANFLLGVAQNFSNLWKLLKMEVEVGGDGEIEVEVRWEGRVQFQLCMGGGFVRLLVF
jgi:hypothetical protein